MHAKRDHHLYGKRSSGEGEKKKEFEYFFEFLRFKQVFLLSPTLSHGFFRKEWSVGGGGISFPIPEAYGKEGKR